MSEKNDVDFLNSKIEEFDKNLEEIKKLLENLKSIYKTIEPIIKSITNSTKTKKIENKKDLVFGKYESKEFEDALKDCKQEDNN